MASRAVSLASRCTTLGAAFRLGKHDGVGLAGDNGIEVGVGHAGVEAIDAHEQARPLLGGPRALEKIQRRGAGGRSFRSGVIESSRSMITASAPLASGLVELGVRRRRERTEESACSGPY